MSKFSFFNPFSWFNSEERKEIEKLRNRITELEGGQVKKEDIKLEPLQPPQKVLVQELPNTPYKNMFVAGTNVTILFHNGDVIMKADVLPKTMEKVLLCKTEEEVKQALYNTNPDAPKKVVPKALPIVDREGNHFMETDKEADIIKEHSHILLGYPDFKIVNGEVFLEDVELAMPAVVSGSFIELAERMKIAKSATDLEDLQNKFESLKLFWCWLALNPIEDARRDAVIFIKKNDITIDVNGLLVMYRKIVSVANKTDNAYVDFVSANYAKVKKNKKSPKAFWVHKKGVEYILSKSETPMDVKVDSLVGNLAELYLKMKDSEGNRYTDAHSKTKDIRVGHVYKEDEENINLNNRVDCGSGLHVGSKSFSFGSFGDTGVIALVNPMYIRSVPKSATNKMRVSEMFIVAVSKLENYTKDVDQQVLLDYSVDYCTSDIETLKKSLSKKDLGKLVCQRQQTKLSVEQVVDVTDILQKRIKNLS